MVTTAAARLGACGVRELRQSVGIRPWPAAQGPRARTGLHRRGGGDATGMAARAGQSRAAVQGRTEAVIAPRGGKRVVHAF